MAHTPGPWRVGRTGCVVADAEVIGGPNGANGPENVAYYGGNLIAESVAPRNAPVLAAAPELLTAARAATHALKSYAHGNGAPDLAREVAKALDAAIAKAEGTEVG
jgi:hypothetical protein